MWESSLRDEIVFVDRGALYDDHAGSLGASRSQSRVVAAKGLHGNSRGAAGEGPGGGLAALAAWAFHPPKPKPTTDRGQVEKSSRAVDRLLHQLQRDRDAIVKALSLLVGKATCASHVGHASAARSFGHSSRLMTAGESLGQLRPSTANW